MPNSEKGPRQLFGEYLRGLRERDGLTQDLAVKRILENADGDSFAWKGQSNLARIELGRVAIQPDSLPTLAAAYGEPLDRMVTAYSALMIYKVPLPRYFNERSKRPPVEANARSSFFSSDAVEMWSLAEIALWERGLAERFADRKKTTLWIVSPTFVDHKNNEFLNIVVDYLLLRGVSLTYFIAESDYGDEEVFGKFLKKVTKRLEACYESIRAEQEYSSGLNWIQRLGTLSAYKLCRDELAWFTSSLVIANPEDTQLGLRGAEGFMIVPVEGAHTLGIPLLGSALEGLVDKIETQTEKNPEALVEDALSSFELFSSLKERIKNEAR